MCCIFFIQILHAQRATFIIRQIKGYFLFEFPDANQDLILETDDSQDDTLRPAVTYSLSSLLIK